MKSKLLELVFGLGPIIVLVLSLFAKPSFDVYKGTTYFDGNEAYDYLVKICHKFRRRVVGSESDFLAGLWIMGEFKSLGYEVYLQNFTTRGFYGVVKAMNVYAIKRGKLSKYIVVMAHRDVVPTTIEGANDNGAGVAVLMELAKIFVKRNLTLSIIFLCTDSEETGLHGARFFVNNFPEINEIVCAISIDMCCWKDASGLSLIAYYYPPKFSDASILLAMLSLRRLGYNVIVDPLDEIMARLNLVFAGTDSMPFVAQGVPAIGICDYPLYPYWHKEEDTLDKVSSSRLQIVGELVERFILTVDSMEKLPEFSQHYLIVSDVYFSWYSLYLTTSLIFIFTIIRVIRHARPSRKGLVTYLILYLLAVLTTTLSTPLCMKLKSFVLTTTIVLAVYSLCVWIVLRKIEFPAREVQGVSIIAYDVLYLPSLILSPEVALILLTPMAYVSALVRSVKKYKVVLVLAVTLVNVAPWALLLNYVFSTYGYKLSDKVLCYLTRLASYRFGLLAYVAIPATISLILVTAVISMLIILRSISTHEE